MTTWWVDEAYERTMALLVGGQAPQRDYEDLINWLASIVTPEQRLVLGKPLPEDFKRRQPYHLFRALQGIVETWSRLAQPQHRDHEPSPAEIFAADSERVDEEEALESHLCDFSRHLTGRSARVEALPADIGYLTLPGGRSWVYPTSVRLRMSNTPTLKVVRLSQDALLPTRATTGSAGLDLYLPNGNLVVVGPGERRLVSTGLQVIVPEGYEGQVRPRSGRAFKDGLTVLNSPGTIDSDYRGELLVLLINLGDQSVTLMPKERIAQFVIAPMVKVRVEEISGHDGPTTRSGGFGSTGS